jgi:hypothetical protein
MGEVTRFFTNLAICSTKDGEEAEAIGCQSGILCRGDCIELTAPNRGSK